MVIINWSVWGDDIISRELLRFEERNLNIMPVGLAIIKDIKDSNQKQFETEGEHASGGWAPLADSTIAAKVAGGFPLDILQRTRRLMLSLTEGTEDTIEEVDPGGFVFGSEVEYGKFHQTGTKTMPQRRPLEFNEVDKVLWMKRIQRYILTGEVMAADLV